jgi:23S rRNA (adenine2503-C2)-methyltransferase
MTNLVGRTPEDLEQLLRPIVDRPFRGQQVAHWIVARHARTFAEMTNLPTVLRQQLEQSFSIRDPEVVDLSRSTDGTSKLLLAFPDGATAEAVAIPDGRKLTLCLSSQAGCALGCSFCVTGHLGPGRDLLTSELVGQYRRLMQVGDPGTERVNIVFMGMGEPLLNIGHLGPALEVLYHTVSPKRITVSTAGIVPGIHWLADLPRRPKLAISLNAPDQDRREVLMPIARTYPLDQLLDALRAFPLEKGRRITFEYVLIDGFNDSIDDARLLSNLLAHIPCKVNLIPLNEDRRLPTRFRQPDRETVESFALALRDSGRTATIRWSRGSDVAAACGQLKGVHSQDPDR